MRSSTKFLKDFVLGNKTHRLGPVDKGVDNL